MFTLTDGRNVTVATELDRTGAVPCLSIREAGVMGHAPLLASMPKRHVSAPILSALGFTESDAQSRNEAGYATINYAGWERIYTQAGRLVGPRFTTAYTYALADDENPAYRAALLLDVATFGLPLPADIAEQVQGGEQS